MNQPASSKEETGEIVEQAPRKFQHTDRDLVCTMIAKGHPYTFFKGSGKTVFEFNMADIEALLMDWKLNKPIPIDDVRKIFRAQTSFNSAVRD